jgi:hypothetical protein
MPFRHRPALLHDVATASGHQEGGAAVSFGRAAFQAQSQGYWRSQQPRYGRHMRAKLIAGLALLSGSVPVAAQEIVKVSQSDTRAVSRPDDLFALPPGQWNMATRSPEGPGPCTAERCEAGIASGEMVVSVEHSGEFVRIIAGFRGCEAVGSSEVEVGKKPGKPTFARIREQMKRVVKGVSKSCNLAAPELPALDAGQLFPANQH